MSKASSRALWNLSLTRREGAAWHSAGHPVNGDAITLPATVRRSPFRAPHRAGGVGYSDLRPRHFLTAIPTLILVLTAAILLLKVPFLNVGWFQMLFHRDGSVLFASNDGSVFGFVVMGLVAVTIALFVFRLASREEEAYRLGLERKTRLGFVAAALLFGIEHLVMGIPLGAALALSIGGAAFGWHYLRTYREHVTDDAPGMYEASRRALGEATLHHAAYNLTVLTLVVTVVVSSLATGRF